MARHIFSFEGGGELTTMGAGWFVSYAFYKRINSAHSNWNKVSTASNRISVYNRTQSKHQFWLEQVLEMSNANLNKNTIGLKAERIKEMAKEIIVNG